MVGGKWWIVCGGSGSHISSSHGRCSSPAIFIVFKSSTNPLLGGDYDDEFSSLQLHIGCHRQLQCFYEFCIHICVVIFNIQNNHFFSRHRLGEFFQQSLAMVLFHDKNDIGPGDHLFVDTDPGFVFSSGRSHLVERMIFENRFRRTTTPLIAAADEEQVHGIKDND